MPNLEIYTKIYPS